MLIGIGCFGLWHRHLALAVNCSFLSHLAKELKPAIFWVRIRHLKKNLHIGKPLRSVEWKKGAGRGMGGYRPHCGVTWFQRERKTALWFPDTSSPLPPSWSTQDYAIPLPHLLSCTTDVAFTLAICLLPPSWRCSHRELMASPFNFCRTYGAPLLLWQHRLLVLQVLTVLVPSPSHAPLFPSAL